jgi:hypothetical protein
MIKNHDSPDRFSKPNPKVIKPLVERVRNNEPRMPQNYQQDISHRARKDYLARTIDIAQFKVVLRLYSTDWFRTFTYSAQSSASIDNTKIL